MQCYLTNPETGWVVKHVVAESHALMKGFRPCPTFRDAFPFQNGWIFGKVPKGGGVIFNPKIYIADFCHYRRYFGHEFQEKFAIWFSEKWGGGGQRPFGTFPKIHPFWKGKASLSEASPSLLFLQPFWGSGGWVTLGASWHPFQNAEHGGPTVWGPTLWGLIVWGPIDLPLLICCFFASSWQFVML